MKICTHIGLVSTLMGVALLAGCQDVKEMVGLVPDAPNEFEVVKKRPLSMPPDFHLLPPEVHTVNRADEQPRDVAKQALVGTPAQNPEEVTSEDNDMPSAPLIPMAPTSQSPVLAAARTQGETGLLAKVSVPADENIRRVIEVEHAEENEGTLGEKIFTWQKENRLKKHEIDPHAERVALEDRMAAQSQEMADAAAAVASDETTITAPMKPVIVPKTVVAGLDDPVVVPTPVSAI